MKSTLVLGTLLSISVNAFALDLNDYLQSYFSLAPNIKIMKLDLQKAQKSYNAQAQLNRLSYTLKPYYQKTDYTIPSSSDFSFRSKSIESTLNYTLPSATTVELGGSYYLSDKSSDDLEQKNHSLSVMLSQPLTRNSFGQMDRRLRAYYLFKKNEAQNDYQTNLQNECAKASLLYLGTFNAQEKLIIASDQYTKSQKVWKQTKKNYKKRLINKLDYLAANSDQITSRVNRLKYKAQYNDSLAKLKKYYSGPNIGELKSPTDILDQIPTKDVNQSEALPIQKYENIAKGSAEYYNHIKSKNRFDVTLFIGAGSKKNDVSQTTTGDSENEYVIAGLSMDIPILNRSNRQENATALADKLIAEHQLKEARLSYHENIFTLKNNIKLIQEMIDATREKIVLYKNQMKEAYRKMNSGKIDFKDYILYRDQFSNEQIALHDQIYSLYENKFKLLSVAETLPTFCEVL